MALSDGILRHFQVSQRDRTFVIQQLGARQLFFGQQLIGFGFLIIGEGSGQVGAVDHQQRLSLGHVIAELGADLDHAAAAQRDDRNRAIHVRRDDAVHVNFIADLANLHRRQLKLAGILHGDHVGIDVGLDDFVG